MLQVGSVLALAPRLCRRQVIALSTGVMSAELSDELAERTECEAKSRT